MSQPLPPYQLPLWAFFKALRQHGFALGVDDYALLIEAMNGGFGLQSEKDLLRLCRTLWYKPDQSWEVFEDQFYRTFRLFRQQLKEKAAGKEPTPPPPIVDPPPIVPPLPTEERSVVPPSRPDPGSQEALSPPISPQAFIHLNITSSREKAGESLPGPEELSQQTERVEFLFQGAYRVITPRQLQNSWKYLPDHFEQKPTEEVDVPASLEKLARSGELKEIVYQTEKQGISRLLTLIDYDGSMVAFHDLAEQIADSAPQARHRLPGRYYFHDVPEGSLFRDSSFSQADEVTQLPKYYAHQKAQILIVSDAGAARGRYEAERVYETRDALQALQPLADRIVWLNPVPKNRWTGTTAEQIARLLVPMFEVSPLGLQQAVNVLSGKYKRMR